MTQHLPARRLESLRARYEKSQAQGSLVGSIAALTQMNLADETPGASEEEQFRLLATLDGVDQRDRLIRECAAIEADFGTRFAEVLSWARSTHAKGDAGATSENFVLCVTFKALMNRVRNRLVVGVLGAAGDHFGRRSLQDHFGCDYPRMAVDRQSVALKVGSDRLRFGYDSSELRRHLQSFFLLEPGLLRWISTFSPGDTFLDIGANIGKYTLFAAGIGGCRTVAVEPFDVNFQALQENIRLNGLEDRVTPLRLAIWDKSVEGALHFADASAGAAEQGFSDPYDATASSPGGETTQSQPVRASRLDDLIADATIEPPSHIKIDVDGEEWRLIEGMPDYLRSGRLKSLRIEIRPSAANQRAVEQLEAAGFRARIDDDRKNVLFRREA